MAQRPPLTLTAELEKLEQSITLTLQEIDHNFSKTHRIVTNSIIPIVERYAKESTAVWEGSKFWKQFFEASANVALSNYQEEEVEEEPTYGEPTAAGADGTTYVTHDSSAFPNSSPANYERTRGPAVDDDGDEILQTSVAAEHHAQGGGGADSDDDDDYLLDDSMLDSLNLTGAITHHSTPKPKAGKPPQQQQQPARPWANIESPFEAFKKELTPDPFSGGGGGRNDAADDDSDTSLTDSLLLPPSTPPTNRSRRRPTLRAHNPSTPTPTTTTTTITSSPFLPPHTARRTPGGGTTDALLHRVLDKNWRVQATPLGKAPASKYRATTTGATTPHSTRRLFTAPHINSDTDSDDDRSPEKPQLHTKHLFSPSPAPGPRAAHLNLGPKTPTTTAKHKGKGKAVLDPWIHNDATNTNSGGEEDEEEEEEEDSDDNILGYSPPQTIQFSFPARKLLATPAREASRRIVKDILMTAGAAGDTSSASQGGGGDSFSSPPFVSGRGGGGGDSDEDIF
ncbi:DASH complex subunit Ask1-domain-containing protein [Morchella snyderi]|nr:DASH complex subunit Ask1-domain-containing protein [Morchella snyderi]